MMLCVIGLPFNFCFKFHEECQHRSFIRVAPEAVLEQS